MKQQIQAWRQVAKNKVKAGWYRLHPYRFPEGRLTLGNVLHVEMIFDDAVFDRLLSYCELYHSVTGKQPICTVMTEVNPGVSARAAKRRLPAGLYAERVRHLSEVAAIGYHGHYWLNPTRYSESDQAIRGVQFEAQAYLAQFQADLHWFETSGIPHQGTYSAGWWFMNEPVQRRLISAGFDLDFSASHIRNFRSPYSYEQMKANSIAPGMPFVVSNEHDEKLLCIQNLPSLSTTPFTQDFVRQVSSLWPAGRDDMIGVCYSHDWDLDLSNALRCLEHLAAGDSVRFFDLHDFRALKAATGLKCVRLGN